MARGQIGRNKQLISRLRRAVCDPVGIVRPCWLFWAGDMFISDRASIWTTQKCTVILTTPSCEGVRRDDWTLTSTSVSGFDV